MYISNASAFILSQQLPASNASPRFHRLHLKLAKSDLGFG